MKNKPKFAGIVGVLTEFTAIGCNMKIQDIFIKICTLYGPNNHYMNISFNIR